MELILAPDGRLETQLERYRLNELHPAPFAMDMIALMEKHHVTFLKNQELRELKKMSGGHTLLGWNIDIRRENEWMA